jgi:PAS domain S-box-containing protein
MPQLSDLVAPDAGAIRFKRLTLGVVVLGILVILAFVGSSLHDAWRSYDYAVAAYERELRNMANALAEQTVWSLQADDLLLLDTARWYRSESQSIPPADIDAALAARVSAVQQVRSVVLIDAQGRTLHRSRPIVAPSFTAADRSYFIAQRDNPALGMFISEPLTTRTEGRTAVILSRRLDDDQGRFAGVVIANVDLEDLNQFYRAIDVGVGGAIQLLREDGTLIVRIPRTADTVGRRYPALAVAPTDPLATVRNPLDGRANFIAVAAVRNTPLRLAVTRDAKVALQPWRDETTRVAFRTVIVVLLAALMLAALLRQIRRVADSQRALRDSEERYSLAMEGANEGHWDWDAASDQLYLSPRMRSLDGERAESKLITAREWIESVRIHDDDRAQFEAALRDHFAGRIPRFECEYRVLHPNGEWHWLLARGRCSFDEAGKPVRFVGSAIDITAQKQAQIDKERLESQLRQAQKMEAIGTLAGGIAHDFNNVLGAILGYGELASQHEAAKDANLKRYLDNVLHAAERAKLLVQRILGFSRSGLGDRVPVNVQAVVRETLELLEASLPVGIRIESELAADTAAVMGDPTYLHQVTMNLCTNAVQAMAGGGVLKVRLEREHLTDPITLSRGSLVPGDYVRLSVADTGAGIPPDILERIFDPFFTTKTVGEGTGLGLSVVHGIIADLGGGIDVSSTLNQGTRVSIWLPVSGELTTLAPPRSEVLPQGHGETVMIVDDEPALMSLAEEIVAGLGYEPIGFTSSRAALEALRAAPDRFDALITDESMPDLVGTELVREIRMLRPSLPILLMSGHGDASLIGRAREVGVEEVLHKPLHGHEIAQALARLLRATR